MEIVNFSNPEFFISVTVAVNIAVMHGLSLECCAAQERAKVNK